LGLVELKTHALGGVSPRAQPANALPMTRSGGGERV